MRLSRTRHMKINMGHYEAYEFGATVTLDHNDLGYTDEDVRSMELADLVAELRKEVLRLLNAELIDEVREAADLTDSDKSFVLQSFGLDRESDGSHSRRKRR